MRKALLIALVAAALVATFISPAAGITNGTPDGDDHPYVGLLVFDAFVDTPEGGGVVPAWSCSGALIAPNVVLTAGHCTEGAVAARIWFNEKLQDDDGTYLVPDFPWGGIVAIEGTPYTNPDYDSPDNPYGGGNGLPAFSYRDVGIVVLDTAIDVGGFAELPTAGFVDTLKNKTEVDFVGYGVQEMIHGGGPPDWTGLRNRMYAPSALVSGNFVHSAEYMRLSLNPGGDKGGTCFGDSGGPDLLGGTNTVLAVNSYVTNYNCAGVGYSARVDVPEVLEWINGFVQAGGLWEHLNFQFGPGRLTRNPDSLNEHLEFRQAIAHAIDKDRIAAEISQADRPIDSYVEAYLPALSQGAWAQYDYDPIVSMQLLDELCAELSRDCSSNPPRAVFTTTSGNASRVQLAGLLDEMLSDVGILFEIQLEEAAVFFGPTLDDGTYDLGLWAWVGPPALDDLVLAHDLFDPEGSPLLGSNVYRWGTPDSSVIDANTVRFAELRDLMNSTSDEAQIVAYIHEAEQILADQAVMIPLYIRVPETP